MSADECERCWNDFASRNMNARWSLGVGDRSKAGRSEDPGTVYFLKVDDTTTEVTIQLDPDGRVTCDDVQTNRRVDDVLDRFKEFIENR